MVNNKRSQHNEPQITRCLQPKYSSKHQLTGPGDTLPRDNIHLQKVILYQGGKWVREDDAYFDNRASALDFFDE